jgi:hypothetical protein
VELEDLCESVAWVESEHTTEAMQLSRSVMEISDVCFLFGTSLHIRSQLRMS